MVDQEVINGRDVEAIIRTYSSCVGLLTKFFRAVNLCSQCYGRDRLGCCADMSRHGSEEGFRFSPAEKELVRRREELRKSILSESEIHGACPYHSAQSGCVLGDLKSPYCAAVLCTEAQGKLQLKYGLMYKYYEIRDLLARMLMGDSDMKNCAETLEKEINDMLSVVEFTRNHNPQRS